jgi:hypothetical protein
LDKVKHERVPMSVKKVRFVLARWHKNGRRNMHIHA